MPNQANAIYSYIMQVHCYASACSIMISMRPREAEPFSQLLLSCLSYREPRAGIAEHHREAAFRHMHAVDWAFHTRELWPSFSSHRRRRVCTCLSGKIEFIVIQSSAQLPGIPRELALRERVSVAGMRYTFKLCSITGASKCATPGTASSSER